MTIERYCTKEGCPGGEGCINSYRTPGQPCTMEYVASGGKYDWKGEGPPPSRWTAPDGTVVYRSYSDYCD